MVEVAEAAQAVQKALHRYPTPSRPRQSTGLSPQNQCYHFSPPHVEGVVWEGLGDAVVWEEGEAEVGVEEWVQLSWT